MVIVDSSAPTATGALPLWLVTDGTLQGWLAERGPEVANWVRANGFLAEKQRVLMLPGAFGNPSGAVVGLGWLIGAYRFTRYRAPSVAGRASLVLPDGADLRYAEAAASATSLARDLVNTPANDLGPAELAAVAADLARRFGATIKVTVGDELKAARFPLIH